jgi:uncharacterized protein YkwD
MNKKLHHYFVATADNVYHPHLLRWWSLAVFGFLVILAQIAFNVTAAQPSILGFATDVREEAVVDFTNQQRAQFGAEPLTVNRKLASAAREKAQHMFDNNYWAHVAPDGTQPWDFFRDQNYSYIYAGENLAKNFATSAGVVDGWMNSQGHRENLLNTDYTEIGIAAVNGQLEGEDTTLVVALYGRSADVEAEVGNELTVTPTPATTTPTPSPTPTPTPQPSQQAAPALDAGQPTTVLGVNAQALTWVQRASLPVFGFIALLYIGQHMVVRRSKMRWDHAAHPRPLLQAGVMIGLMVAVVISGQGIVL